MGYFFIGLSYIFQTLIIDLTLVANAIVINNFYIRYRNLYPYNNSARYYMTFLAIADLIILVILYLFFTDILISSMVIILF